MSGSAISIGDRFGRLTVIAAAEPYVEPSGRKRGRSLCLCDCGNQKAIHNKALTGGATKSCGCFRREVTVSITQTHGQSRKGKWTPTYRSWASMIERCTSVTREHSEHYVERGITVCERWRKFDTFLEDMGERPSLDHSIDRIDVNGNYEPGNCRWATKKEQTRNKRNNKIVEYQGRKMPLVEAAELAGLPYGRVQNRIWKLGWSAERALSK